MKHAYQHQQDLLIGIILQSRSLDLSRQITNYKSEYGTMTSATESSKKSKTNNLAPVIVGADISSQADLVSDAREQAILRCVDLLRHPDDLTNKLSSIKKKFHQERASVEAQIKTCVEYQLDDASVGLDTLKTTTNQTEAIRKHLSTVHHLCSDSQNTINNYSRIQKLSNTHQNFLATKALIEEFKSLNAQVERVRQMLDEDAKHILGPAGSMLFVHFQFAKLQEFRNNTFYKAKGSSSDILHTLDGYFRKVDELEAQFEAYMWKLTAHCVALVRKGRYSTIVRLVKIIEEEERKDELAVMKELNEDPTDPNSTRPRTMKSYRIKFFDVLRASITEEVLQIYETNKNDLSSLFRAADGILDVLTLVNDELVPRFPSKYNIFHFFVLEYHRAIHEMVSRITSSPMEAGWILELLKWVRQYYNGMHSRLDVSEDLLEPKLLDGREDSLISEYLEIVKQKLSEWLKNILATEVANFIARKYEPEIDGSGHYILQGSVIVFQMFNQQIDVVLTSGRAQLLCDVISECCNILELSQAEWAKVMDSEFQKFSTDSKDLVPGLVDYLMAMANDCIRCTEFAETIMQRLEPALNEKWRTIISAKLKVSVEGFMKLSKKAYYYLIDIVLLDIKSAINVMFCLAWYEQDVMALVVGTIQDYNQDFQDRLSEYVFNKVSGELMDRLVLAYLDSFKNKAAKFKMPSAGEKIRRDLDSLVTLFTGSKSAKRVKAAFDVIEKINAFLCAEPSTAFLDFYSLWKAYPDVPLDFIEWLVNRRDDLDRTAIRDLMEQCKSKASVEAGSSSGTSTLFAKAFKGP